MHFEMIDIFKKYLCETRQLILNEKSNYLSPNPNTNTNLNLNAYKKTPKLNQNYNFDRASPYYINITHRRKNKIKTSEISPTDYENELSSPKNLFQLTETNLREFTNQSDNVRRSLIDNWRNKVQQLKPKKSINLDEINEILNSFIDSEISFQVPLSSTHKHSIENNDVSVSNNSGSFETAQNNNDENNQKYNKDLSIVIKSPKISAEFMYHVTEDYICTDDECGIAFLERKIHAEPVANQ